MATAAVRPPVDRRELTGPFDIIGDVHGCGDELEELLAKLGYTLAWESDGETRRARIEPPGGRTLVFVGDLVDRGPRTPDVLRIGMANAREGGLCVEGNHENKLARWLAGRKVTHSNGLQASIDQLRLESEAFRREAQAFLETLPGHLWLDGGALVIAHAGLKDQMIGRDDGKTRAFALYGDVTGQTDADGYPVRRDWTKDREKGPAIVYGHVAAPEAEWVNNTICLDTGCVYGGRLTALRWPERELVQVDALQEWYTPKRALEDRVRYGVSDD